MNASGNVGFAILLTALAGLSTGIGSGIAYAIRKPKAVYLSFGLGFSAGAMIYISFVELLPAAVNVVGKLQGAAVFFAGVGLAGLLDLVIPSSKSPHHFGDPDGAREARTNPALMRVGVMTALAVGIHNFPEGLATFGAALTSVRLGTVTAIAIAVHNIPEGVAVSLPILYATGNRRKAFALSFASGLAEPVGAAIGYLVLLPFLSDTLIAALLAFVAGIMVYISLDVLPIAHRGGHAAVLGTVLGMLVMAASLLML
jgi:ZIP family zinc transporter